MALVVATSMTLAACGAADPSGEAGSVTATSVANDRLAPTSTPGDPRDLISLTNRGEAQTMIIFENYQQLRDYADTSIIGTLVSARVTSDYLPPFAIPGELELDFKVDAVLGGRFTDIAVDDLLRVVLPMHAQPELAATLRDDLAELEGTARYALFLQQLVGEGTDPTNPRFRPILYGAPPAILAEWPNDGRLTDLQPHDYIVREAIARGEERTGTSAPTEPDWTPTFRGDAPIGLTVAEAAESFAETPGRPTAPPPAGWERVEPLLAPA